MSLYVHFGAGNIGRALAGPIFRRAGYDVIFVDTYQPVINALHESGTYTICVKDELQPGEPGEIVIDGVDALSVNDTEALKSAIASADLVGTAVGSAHIENVLRAMVPGIQARGEHPISILFCENFNGVAQYSRNCLKNLLPDNYPLMDRIGFVETSIGKMVPIMPDEIRQNDPLLVWAESYNRIIADRNGFAGNIPDGIVGLDLKECFQAYVERKLFIHNVGHATCACHGYLKGYTLVCDAIRDAEVLNETRSVMMECALALIKCWPSEFNNKNQHEHVEDLIRRFGNRALGDTIYRVGRDLHRKLAPSDRFIGALRLVQSTGGDCSAIYRAISAALQFKATDENSRMYPDDAAFHQRLINDGVETVLRSHCGLTQNEILKIISDMPFKSGRITA